MDQQNRGILSDIVRASIGIDRNLRRYLATSRRKGKTMTKAISFAWAALVGVALLSAGCSNSSSDQSSAGGGKSSSVGSAGSGGGAGGGGSASKSSSAGSGGSASSGGKSSASSGGAGSNGSSSGGSTTSSAACDTTDGTYQESTTFQTSGETAPYTLNKWGNWGNATAPTLSQTTMGPSGLDCSSGCAALTMDFSSGTKQYSAGSFVEFFGTSSDSVTNLLNETITVKVALEAKQASGANKDVPISISLFGQDPTTSSNGVDNVWIYDLGSASSLDTASGWHTMTYKVVDASVPSWNPTRTVCASGLHAIGITVQNNETIDDSNGSVVTLYIQSVTVGSGGGSGGTGGTGGSVQGGSSSGGATAGGPGGTGGGDSSSSSGKPDAGHPDTRQTSGPEAGASEVGTGGFDPCPASGNCKILPLGDSITAGAGQDPGDGGGYRDELFVKAINDKKHITFVGSQASGPSTLAGVSFPRNHEGHIGWKIVQVSDIATTSSALKDSPHIVLLFIGTNDEGYASSATGASDRLGKLIDKIIQALPQSLLVVSSIYPFPGCKDGSYTPTQCATNVATYNQAIPGIVRQRADGGKHVLFVDMSTLPEGALSPDGVHPNASVGYPWIGDNWYRMISPYLH
jgi:lysophospholipase L1-like esterase